MLSHARERGVSFACVSSRNQFLKEDHQNRISKKGNARLPITGDTYNLAHIIFEPNAPQLVLQWTVQHPDGLYITERKGT